MRNIIVLSLALAGALTVQAQSYKPEVHGTIMGKVEYQTGMSAYRFQLRNARISLSGKVLPIVSYKAEMDFCDEGTMKVLDAYARVTPLKGFDITIGHMRVPFTIDAYRSPHLQYFGNRSFIAKQVGNLRDVGAMLGYTTGEQTKLSIDAGLFNGSGLSNQKEWNKSLSYSVKAELLIGKQWNFTLSSQSLTPKEARINALNAGIYYDNSHIHIEGEYVYRSYAHNAYQDVHAFDGFVAYHIPLKKVFNRISILARYDMMTDQSDGKSKDEESGALFTTDYKRHRVTGGITLAMSKVIHTEIRLNYEKYLYAKNSIAKESEQDKVVLALMLRY
jgi:hypothetical protein